MEHQIRRQAPPGAVGYRLVLPGRGEDLPHILPLSSTPGAATSWRLDPFEPPDDLRLQDGRLYRLLFVDERGIILNPQKKYIPALRFFLGPPDPLSVRQQREFVEVLDRIEDPQTRDEAAQQFLELRVQKARRQEQAQAFRMSREQAEALARQTEAMQKKAEALREEQRRQAREEAERARAEAAASRARFPWIIGSISLGTMLLGVLGAWLGPKLVARFKSLPNEQAGELAGKFIEDARQIASRLGLARQVAGIQRPPAAPAVDAAAAPSASATVAPSVPPAPSLTSTATAPVAAAVPAAEASSQIHAPETAERDMRAPSEAAASLRETPTDVQGTPPIESAQSTRGPTPAPNPATERTDEPAPSSAAAANPQHGEPAVLSAASLGLSEPELEKLALLVCDIEKQAYLAYEHQRATCRERQLPEPPPPSLPLSDAERKELAQLAADPLRMNVIARLCIALHEILPKNPEQATRLPRPFRSLPLADAQRIQSFVRDPERRRYLDYVLALGLARTQGKPPPSEPFTSLSGEARRQIRRQMTDMRCLFYAWHLYAVAEAGRG
ncbi:MAG: hypothetical protein U1A78_05490 [Polyangia bacterium]